MSGFRQSESKGRSKGQHSNLFTVANSLLSSLLIDQTSVSYMLHKVVLTTD